MFEPGPPVSLGRMPTLTLRERSPDDLSTLHRWLHAEPDPEWKGWDAPYFHAARPPSPLSLAEFSERARAEAPSPHRRVIALEGVCIGMVTRTEEAPVGGGWWELGVLIHDPAHWGADWGRGRWGCGPRPPSARRTRTSSP